MASTHFLGVAKSAPEHRSARATNAQRADKQDLIPVRACMMQGPGAGFPAARLHLPSEDESAATQLAPPWK